MNSKRMSYNARLLVSVFLSLACAASCANYFLELGIFGASARKVFYSLGIVGVLYAVFLTPEKAEFREHGWWWKKGD